MSLLPHKPLQACKMLQPLHPWPKDYFWAIVDSYCSISPKDHCHVWPQTAEKPLGEDTQLYLSKTQCVELSGGMRHTCDPQGTHAALLMSQWQLCKPALTQPFAIQDLYLAEWVAVGVHADKCWNSNLWNMTQTMAHSLIVPYVCWCSLCLHHPY